MTLLDVLQIVAALVLVVGCAFSAIAGLGVLRLPDLYTRMHSASKAGVVGAGLILIAVAVVALDYAVVLRCLLGLSFLILTTPVSAHLLARSALRAGVRPTDATSTSESHTFTSM